MPCKHLEQQGKEETQDNLHLPPSRPQRIVGKKKIQVNSKEMSVRHVGATPE
jgi:hypothetical protein